MQSVLSFLNRLGQVVSGAGLFVGVILCHGYKLVLCTSCKASSCRLPLRGQYRGELVPPLFAPPTDAQARLNADLLAKGAYLLVLQGKGEFALRSHEMHLVGQLNADCLTNALPPNQRFCQNCCIGVAKVNVLNAASFIPYAIELVTGRESNHTLLRLLLRYSPSSQGAQLMKDCSFFTDTAIQAPWSSNGRDVHSFVFIRLLPASQPDEAEHAQVLTPTPTLYDGPVLWKQLGWRDQGDLDSKLGRLNIALLEARLFRGPSPLHELQTSTRSTCWITVLVVQTRAHFIGSVGKESRELRADVCQWDVVQLIEAAAGHYTGTLPRLFLLPEHAAISSRSMVRGLSHGDLLLVVAQSEPFVWLPLFRGQSIPLPDLEVTPAPLTLEVLSIRPHLFALRGFFSAEECLLIRSRIQGLEPSLVGEGYSPVRNSFSASIRAAELPTTLRHRIGTLLRLGLGSAFSDDQQYEIQVARYTSGQHYLSHYDRTSFGGSVARIATLIVYISAPELGGETNFPYAGDSFGFRQSVPDGGGCRSGLSVAPKLGTAVLFYNFLPLNSTHLQEDSFAQHAGCSVLRGEKTIVTVWARWFGNFVELSRGL